MIRYYCIMRPPAPGAIPKGAVITMDYGERRYIPEIDRMAWGWVEFRDELTHAEISEYELIREPLENETFE